MEMKWDREEKKIMQYVVYDFMDINELILINECLQFIPFKM